MNRPGGAICPTLSRDLRASESGTKSNDWSREGFMKRIALCSLFGLALGFLPSSPASARQNPCTGPYDPVSVAPGTSGDLNLNGQICQARKKEADPQTKDDRQQEKKK
jgi:hypothetical protein